MTKHKILIWDVYDANRQPSEMMNGSQSISSILSSLSSEMETDNVCDDEKDTSIAHLPYLDNQVLTGTDGSAYNNSIDDYACAITSNDRVERSTSGENCFSNQTVLDAGDTTSSIPLCP